MRPPWAVRKTLSQKKNQNKQINKNKGSYLGSYFSVSIATTVERFQLLLELKQHTLQGQLRRWALLDVSLLLSSASTQPAGTFALLLVGNEKLARSWACCLKSLIGSIKCLPKINSLFPGHMARLCF